MPASTDSASPQVFIGRQPIFDREEKIVGFELLFRAGNSNEATVVNPDAATEDLLHTAIIDIGLDRLVGNHLVFLNLTPAFAESSLLDALPPEQTVLELGRAPIAAESYVHTLTRLKERGFRIAFNQGVVDGHPGWLPSADYIKLDVLDGEPAVLAARIADWNLPTGSRLIATRVETRDLFEQCRALAFDYFQGYFLSYPNVVEGRRLQTHQLVLLRMLKALQSATTSLDDLVDLITKDPGLIVALLRLINSPRFRRSEPVDSIKQALNLLGRDELARWALLLCLRAASPNQHAVESILVRARFAALLAPYLEMPEDHERLFLLGLLSAIEGLFGVPLPQILDQMRVEGRIRAALLDREGEFEPVLEVLEAFEGGELPQPVEFAARAEDLSRCYLHAVAWTRESLAELTEVQVGADR